MKSLVSILLILGGIALIFWAGNPLWKEIQILRVERSGISATLSELQNLQDIRDNLLSTYNSISKPDLDKLNQVIPQSTDIGNILISLEKIAQDRGIRLRKAEFKADQEDDIKTIQASNPMFNIIDISFVVSASYDSFKSFLDALEKNSRILDVTNISFSVGQTNLYEFTVQADAYYGKLVNKIDNLRDISRIKIDTSFFADPRFVGLETAPAPSLDIKKGRTNPFVPI